ncbi:MAG: alpha/beta fold hydrolase [Eubacterium sp.]|nr:alpha/beta fold hydrolase [Eubacterium sp.]
MVKNFDINEQKYSIRCKYYCGKDPHSVTDIVIATYGFGGNKDNSATEKFAERLISKYKHFGVVVFDWPAHGADSLNRFLPDECVTYFDLAVNYARQEMHAQNLYAYGTSLGGYITLRYLTEHGDPFRKIALRCPAINLYDIMMADITPDEQTKLDRGKEIVRGYTRKIRLTSEFFDQLRAADVRKREYFDFADDMLILQGTKDAFIPFDTVREFAEDNVIELIRMENADHPFSDPGIMDLAISKIIDFFHPEQ